MSELAFKIDKDLLKSDIDHRLSRLEQNRKRDARKTARVAIFGAAAAATTSTLIAFSKFSSLEPIQDVFQGAALVISGLSAILLA